MALILFSCNQTNNFYQGQVTDENNKPLEGVIVAEDRIDKHTKTDKDGYFKLDRSQDWLGDLIFVKEGYKTDTIPSVSNQAGETTEYQFIKNDTTIVRLQLVDKIKLGENIDEINAIAKNIYKKNGNVYVEIDMVQIKFKNIDERVIVNDNSKIRTYLIDSNTLIYSNDCKRLSPSELLKNKDTLLNDKSIIMIGQSKDGKMIDINFGCYG
ncbi:carboxypeptidase-like protein [Flavobacterium tiangeerense]|uniref:Carboxypeptidase-like protein n=2 Tax=Flavobacterium tiangeerense TaxID=459471 RepID=A0ABY3FJ83_9FLAO|nr:carboxypeptidase-like protein [Flavobacterium tiangeerense]